jgi:hypothetical protein
MFDVPLVAVLMNADPFDVEEGPDELAELGLLKLIGHRRDDRASRSPTAARRRSAGDEP